ncbi:hypothetical protein ABW20_dc0102173 [Dactylellina cionopaga]|nr:hypothetical protein ABW20_dc0102173 [Dactylellina cionopaga]
MKIQTFISTSLSLCTLAIAAPTAQIALETVESKKLQALVSLSSLETKIQELYSIAQRHNGTRAIDTPGHAETLDWIESYIPKEYYNIERQYFTVNRTIYDEVSLKVDGVAQKEVGNIFGSGNGTVTAPMVLISNFGCNATDFPMVVAGKIAIVNRGGDCDTGKRIAFAGRAGAAGFILWDIEPTLWRDNTGEFGMTWAAPPSFHNITEYVPSAVIGLTEGQALVEKFQLKDKPFSDITITITNIYHMGYIPTANIIATTKGGNQNSIITVGAHSDSVPEGPGINDNGSGSIAQIEIARALTQFSVNNAVRFCWWSAEELGLLGSEHYVKHLSDAEAAKIVMNLDFDMLASPNYIFGVYDGDGSSSTQTKLTSSASGLIEQTFIDFFKENGHGTVPMEFDGRSDYAPFLEVGIPGGGILMGDAGNKTAEQVRMFGGKEGQPYDPCYHQACDDVKNINYEAYMMGTRCVADAVAKYARTIEGFPFPRSAKSAA